MMYSISLHKKRFPVKEYKFSTCGSVFNLIIMNYMNKKIILISLAFFLVLAAAAGGYFYFKNLQKPAGTGNSENNIGTKAEEEIKAEQGGAEEDVILENSAKGTIPSVQIDPMENKPDINPADKTNPYTDIKINPFE